MKLYIEVMQANEDGKFLDSDGDDVRRPSAVVSGNYQVATVFDDLGMAQYAAVQNAPGCRSRLIEVDTDVLFPPKHNTSTGLALLPEETK